MEKAIRLERPDGRITWMPVEIFLTLQEREREFVDRQLAYNYISPEQEQARKQFEKDWKQSH